MSDAGASPAAPLRFPKRGGAEGPTPGPSLKGGEKKKREVGGHPWSPGRETTPPCGPLRVSRETRPALSRGDRGWEDTTPAASG